ncbi:MAG: hypothetical protein ABI641_10605 [Caldimonas sp.]
MPNADDVLWFKSQFQSQIEPALAGTPFSVDMLTAVACQETGEIWPALRRRGLPVARVLELCIGDTIDASATGGGRRAFPKNKAELLAEPGGGQMFDIARRGLVEMAEQIPGYRGAAARPDKFCHGFGIFQLDLQFFRTDPSYFLERRYADFGAALARCVGELQAAARRIGLAGRVSLSDLEMCAVAIAYNTGRFVPARGLKQGYFDGTRYYGENFHAYLQLAKGVAFMPLPLPPAPATRGANGAGIAAAATPLVVVVVVRAKPRRSRKTTKPTGMTKTTKSAKSAKARPVKLATAAKAPKAAKVAKTARTTKTARTAKSAKSTKPAKTVARKRGAR